MTPSIIRDKHVFKTAAAILFWIVLWQLLSDRIGQEILLVSPVSVLMTLSRLVLENSFWQTVWFSFSRIVLGFLLALLFGTLFAVLAHRLPPVKILLSPLVAAIKSIPVASFVILLLIWIKSDFLSVPTSFLMVLPIAYTNILEGIAATDRKLLEMAQVFQVPARRRVLYIYLSNVLPFFVSACRLGLGLCWKAGVAAEVIGIPRNSIGIKLYQAKLYLETAELFAWTLVIIFISVVFEKVFMGFITRLVRRAQMR